MSDNEIFEIEEDNSKVFIPKSKNKANKNKKKAKATMTTLFSLTILTLMI